MSNEPGGRAPLPDPYTVPGGHTPGGGPVPPPPSGYEAVLPPADPSPQMPAAPYSAPAAPYVASTSSLRAASYDDVPPPATNPFTPPVGSFAGPSQHETQTGSAYGSPPGYPSPYGPAPRGAAYGTPPTPYGTPSGGSPYGAPPTEGHPAGYGQPQGYGSPYGGPPQYGTPYGAGPYVPYGSGYPGPVPSTQTEPLAIASIATSIGGLLILAGLTGPVGLFLGIAALRRIRTNGKQGRGLAITGIAVGSVGVAYLLFVVVVMISLFTGAAWTGASSYGEDDYTSSGDGWSDGETDEDTIPSYALRTDLQVGDCLDVYPYEWDLSDTNVISCTLPHEGEVLSLVTLSGPVSETYGTADPAWDAAWDECAATASDLLGDRIDGVDVMLYAPHPDDFASGGTTAYCTYFTYEGPIDGSAVDQTLAPAPGSAT